MARRRRRGNSFELQWVFWILGALLLLGAVGSALVKVIAVALMVLGWLLLLIVAIVAVELVAWTLTRRRMVLISGLLRVLGRRPPRPAGDQMSNLTTLRPALNAGETVRLIVWLAPPNDVLERVGIMPSWWRFFLRGLREVGHGLHAAEQLQQASATCPPQLREALTLWLGLVLASTGRDEEALALLEDTYPSLESQEALARRVRSAQLIVDLGDDRSIVDHDIQWDLSHAAALAMAGCRYAAGDVAGAAGALGATRFRAERIALLLEAGEWESLIAATNGIRNNSDRDLNDLLVRARAFRELGKQDAALAVLEMCVKSSRRSPLLLLMARYQRGRLLLQMGRRSAARRELARVYAEDPRFEEIAALMGELDAQAAVEAPAREPIPDRVKDRVWRRDRGMCVKCGSQERLEFDHIIPVSKGGANTVRNLQLLCETCNRRKGAELA